MLEISLFVLVLQIGFNAALNSRSYMSNPLISSTRFVNSEKTRRLPDSDNYLALSSRGIPASDSEQSDSEYSSFEDYSFRSIRPLQSRAYPRRNDYSRYENMPDNDVSFDSAPVRRIEHTDPNFRRPYLRHRQSNLRQDLTRKQYRKAYDDLSLEVSSVETTNPEDASRLGEEASYLRSLYSLIEKSNNRRDQNRKYYRGDNLSLEVSPIDKLDADEDAINSLPNFPYKRRNVRKEYDNNEYNLRSYASSPAKNIPGDYIDTILLVSDDDKTDEITTSSSTLGNPEQTGDSNNQFYNRRYGELYLDDDNNLSPFRGLKPRKRKLTNNSPLTRKYNRKNYDNAEFESSSNSELFPDDDSAEQLTIFRLSSLEDLSLESPLLRTSDQNDHNNKQNNHRNFLRLSLSPDSKITLDESLASDLSKLLSQSLDELIPEPLNLRRSLPLNSKYSRKELKKAEENLSNHSVLRLGSLDTPYAESPLRRYRERTNRSSNSNFRRNENDHESLKHLYYDDPTKNLVPYHEFKGDNPENERNEKQYMTDEDFPDEFSLDTLFDFKKEDYDEILNLNDNVASNLSALRATNQENLSLESSDENQSKEKADALQLEFPWSDQLQSIKDKNSSVSALRDLDSQLRSERQTNQSKDSLNLEFPWNDILSSDNDTNSKPTVVPKLTSPSQLRSNEQKGNTKDTNDSLHLEFPWNDQINPDDDKSSKLSVLPKLTSTSLSQLRINEQKGNTKDNTDSLHLELPWNDQLNPDDDKSSKLSVLPKLTSPSQLRINEQKGNTKDNSDSLHLEFPWNDQLNPDDDKSSKLSVLPKLRFPSQLRSIEQNENTKNTTDSLHLEFPWNNQLSPDNDKSSKLSILPKHKFPSQLRSIEQNENTKDTTDSLHLEFPWNDQLSPDNDKSSKLSVLPKVRFPSQLRSIEQTNNTKDTTDSLHLEFPWNDQLSPDNDKSSKLSILPKHRFPSQLRSIEQNENTNDTTDSLNLEFPWNDQLSPDIDKSSKLSILPKHRFPSQLRSIEQNENTKDTTDSLHLEFPWNDQLSPGSDKSSKLSILPKHRFPSLLRSIEQENNTKDTTDSLHLEFPWNDQLSPDNDKSSKLSILPKHRFPSQLRSIQQKDNTKDTTDSLHLEFPWNDQLSSNEDKISSIPAHRLLEALLRSREKTNKIKNASDLVQLEFPWNDILTSNDDKSSKLLVISGLTSPSQLKNNEQKLNPSGNKSGALRSQSLLRSLLFPWNDKTSPDKLRKNTAAVAPDPFYVHPHLRNRNIQIHPNYYSRSYEEFNEGVNWLKNIVSPSESHRRIINRRRNKSQRMLSNMSRRLKESGDVTTFPIDGRPQRLRTLADHAPPLATTTHRPRKLLRNLY